MEAATPVKTIEETEKDKREKEIREKEKFLLEKYFEGRKYDDEKIKKWSNFVLEEMNEFLNSKYPLFGSGIFLFVSKAPISYCVDRQSIFVGKTDSSITEVFKNDNFKISLRVYITKLKKQKFNVENVQFEHIMKINKIFNDTFEGRSFSDNKLDKYLENAVNDINSYLLKFDELGHSFHQGFVFKNNTENINFYYKFGNMRFFPYCCSYANDSLLAHLFLFIVSN